MIDFARPLSSGLRASPEDLGDEIARLSAHIEAATGHLLTLIREFDASEGWYEEGFTSCASWLSWRTGISPGTARERVRVARALGELPALRGALGSGQLSYSVARALTRIATPDNEAELVEVARHSVASDLERLVSAWRRADRAEAEELEDEREGHARREVWLIPRPDGRWRLLGDLDPEVGAVLSRALEAAGEALYGRKASSPEETTPQARRADAIGLVAERALGGGLAVVTADSDPAPPGAPVAGRAERFQVVVHVSAETLDGSEANLSRGDLARGDAEPAVRTGGVSDRPAAARIEGGPHIPRETARRLACDAGVVTLTEDGAGNVLDVGRRRRTVPAALRRALDHRDAGCRFPGCLSRFCDAHHIEAWAAGGETKLDNLLLLCRRHHRRVHEDGWRVSLSAETGEIRFRRPDGPLLPRVPERPPVWDQPARALQRRHRERGVAIHPSTPTPHWTGEHMDIDWALFTLSQHCPGA